MNESIRYESGTRDETNKKYNTYHKCNDLLVQPLLFGAVKLDCCLFHSCCLDELVADISQMLRHL